MGIVAGKRYSERDGNQGAFEGTRQAMHILVTGNGRAGSWVIRGQQLGETIGAEICPNAGKRDLADADLVVVVKRTPSALLSHLTELKKRWIFDCVDFWPQPIGNEWPRDGAV